MLHPLGHRCLLYKGPGGEIPGQRVPAKTACLLFRAQPCWDKMHSLEIELRSVECKAGAPPTGLQMLTQSEARYHNRNWRQLRSHTACPRISTDNRRGPSTVCGGEGGQEVGGSGPRGWANSSSPGATARRANGFGAVLTAAATWLKRGPPENFYQAAGQLAGNSTQRSAVVLFP